MRPEIIEQLNNATPVQWGVMVVLEIGMIFAIAGVFVGSKRLVGIACFFAGIGFIGMMISALLGI